MTQKIGVGLLEYAGKIWNTADTLRGAGIKESKWPTYMMPFFARMMLEFQRGGEMMFRDYQNTRFSVAKRQAEALKDKASVTEVHALHRRTINKCQQ